MKKLFLVFSIVLLAIAAVAQSKFYVYKTDGSATEFLINDVDSISFVAPTTGTENGYEWVDLGLPSGLRWATCNVGATKPEEYGSYFAWGEVEPKSTYSWSTYKFMDSSVNDWTGVNKYTFADGQTECVWYDNSGNFIGDNKTVLDKEDDAAVVNMGGSWRMPTKAEQDELRTECTWTWTTLNDVNGYNVEGPNGNSIFLPAAGCRYGSDLGSAGSLSGYWSSSLSTYYLDHACFLYFYSDRVHCSSHVRYYGFSVRGVCAATSTPAASKGIGAFSVSADKQVAFSPGNLQYTQSTNTWSFAENQWECVGTDNVTGGEVTFNKYGYYRAGIALADKVDLFGWGTGANPTNSSTYCNDYQTFVDWGTNQIGEDVPNTWRTLTNDEWNYLLNSRTNASSLMGVAQVNGVNGLILLPDGWSCPDGVTFKSGFHDSYCVDCYAAYQTFTAAEWSKMEVAGAVFLPAAGLRSGSEVPLVQGDGSYWSATEYDSNFAYCLVFISAGASMSDLYRYSGHSVRLVKDL